MNDIAKIKQDVKLRQWAEKVTRFQLICDSTPFLLSINCPARAVVLPYRTIASSN